MLALLLLTDLDLRFIKEKDIPAISFLLSSVSKKTWKDHYPYGEKVRADWLVHHLSKGSNYYKALGVSSAEDFFKLAGKGKEDLAALQTRSIVSRSYQAIYRENTVNGYLWKSKFVDADKDTLQFLLSDLLSDLSGEGMYIASLPNGLQAYAIIDKEGKLVEHVDEKEMHHQGKLVHAGLNCCFCHVSGVEKFNDTIREMLKFGDFKTKEVKDAKRLADLFRPDLKETIEADQKKYRRIVKKFGKPEEIAKSLQNILEEYQKDVSFEQVAREIGVTEEELKKRLMRFENSQDFDCASLLLRKKISRERFERLFSKLKG